MSSVWLTMSSLVLAVSSSPTTPSHTVNAGSEVVLPCGLAHQGDRLCHWLKDGWMMEVGEVGDTRITGRNCDLVISPVLPLDQGQYQCQVSGDRPIKSPAVLLSVNTEPSHPEIQQGDRMMVERGDMLEISCHAAGANPAAEIEWWNVKTGERYVSEVTQHVQRTGGSFKTTSILKLSPREYTEIFCSSHSVAFPAGRKSSPLQISIKGKPRMESIELSQGESCKIFCQHNKMEENVRFKWFINDNRIFDEESEELEIRKFTKDYDKSVIKCVKENSEGKDEILRRVRLIYNQNRQLPVSASISPDEREKKTFICVSDSEEATEPKYIRIDSKPFNQNHSEYKFSSVDKNYKCKLVKDGVKKITEVSEELKSMSKKLKRFSRYFEENYN